MKKLFFVFIVFTFISCNTKTSDNVTEVIKINLRKNPDNKETEHFLNKISSVRLVPLESTDESLFSSLDIYEYGDNLFAMDYKRKIIKRFDKEGNFINTIDRYGQGPEEYTRTSSIALADNQLNLLQFKKIQQYDFEGNYIKTIPLNPEEDAYQIFLTPDNEFVIAGSFLEEYYLKKYNENGEKIGVYFPARERYAGMEIEKPAENTLGWYKDGVYFCQYYDHNIYHLKDNEIKLLYEIDLSADKLPDDSFHGSGEEKDTRLQKYRYKYVVSLTELIINDNWIVFAPSKWKGEHDVYTVYYDKRDGTYIHSPLPSPYSVLFGGGYPNPRYRNGEFYNLVLASDLKDLITILKEQGTLKEYDFLKDIDPDSIMEDDNPWVVYYSLK